jgi:hypothetical protein
MGSAAMLKGCAGSTSPKSGLQFGLQAIFLDELFNDFNGEMGVYPTQLGCAR